MAREQIIEKLNKFLVKHGGSFEECHVVYFMVELRKLLDREKEEGIGNKYPLVRFHADWVVHTKKERITPIMKNIMAKIDNSIDIYPKGGNIDFLLLPEFRKELEQLLTESRLPNEFCKNNNSWIGFMLTLAQVLADQPIVNPTDNIAEFCYIDVGKEGIMANIDFKGVRAGSSITLGFGL